MASGPTVHDPDSVPILPLRNSVLFPLSVVPINVGRARSVRLVEELFGRERVLVGVLSQKSAEVDEPTFDDLHTMGTLARVVKVIRLGPTSYSVVLNGLGRLRLVSPLGIEPYMRARIERLPEPLLRDPELDALGSGLREATRELLTRLPNPWRDTSGVLDNVREAGALADLIASNFPQAQASVDDKQAVLETLDPKERVRRVRAMVDRHSEVLRVKEEITTMVNEELGKSQREHVLRQQMRSIREELGEPSDDELEELRERVWRAKVPAEVEKVARKQLSRLRSLPPQASEYNLTRNYVEWIADLPWSKTTTDKLSVAEVRRCLDEDHLGLDRVKKRIVEYSAIRQLRRDKKGPILLFIGPPGVGKTSLGKSIARAMGRRYERIALGGVRDEAEIRGHRRTYVGALPGRILQALKKAGTRNPVIVLDEIDKLGADMRGDPAAALLEVLDPEQNSTFQDHYLDLPFDLSQVLFLATANNREGISAPLMDRMEVIEVPGYTRNEKLGIAREFLVPKQLSSHGLTDERLDFTDEGVGTIVDSYTREAGVRGLERQIAAVCRATAVRLAEGVDVRDSATPEHVEQVLGPRRYRPETAERELSAGVATGLAWTPSGGDLLFIEATKMPGKAGVVLTGNLRNVMQESAALAVSYVRSRAERLHLDPEWLKSIDLHLHVPKHATPKDGPSAGVAMFTAVSSLLLGAPVRGDLAMTGEISLRGKVLKVGGVKEKLLAAHRAGIREVLLPAGNKSDLDELPDDVKAELDVTLVSHVDEVLPLALQAPKVSPASVREEAAEL